MASLRDCARIVLDEAKDGLEWIALWKEGRSWRVVSLLPLYVNFRKGTMELRDYTADFVQAILEDDKNAIFINGRCTDLGDTAAMNAESLETALRRQYEDCQPLIRDWTIKAVP